MWGNLFVKIRYGCVVQYKLVYGVCIEFDFMKLVGFYCLGEY